jgi:hypothetical protein
VAHLSRAEPREPFLAVLRFAAWLRDLGVPPEKFPFVRAINPITKNNWEGTSVEPDVKVPAADALATAQKLAAEKLPSK